MRDNSLTTEPDAGESGQSRDLFRLLVQSVRDYAIFLLDTTGHVMSWNEGAQYIKGYRAEEIIGRHFSIFFPAEEIERAKPEYELRVAVAEGRYEEEGWRIRRDGTRFWANVVITALFDTDGKHIGFAKVTRDLTERKRAQEEAMSARREADIASARLQARDEFLSIAAHELKTPMTSLRIAAQQLMRRIERNNPPDLTQLEQSLKLIDRQSQRLSRLVTHLLETARMQAGRLELTRTRVDLSALVAEMAGQADMQSIRHQFIVKTAGPVWVQLDAERFEQVLVNLFDNAIKFSPAGGTIEISVDAVSPDTARLCVRDHGLGVSPEYRSRLFERFYQAHAPEHRSGMGLGLYISRQIVEMHGGRIQAEFPDDGGAQFVVELPSSGEEPEAIGS